MTNTNTYPIGTPGKKWGEAEKEEWLAIARIERSYKADVLDRLFSLSRDFEIRQYGALDFDTDRYPLFAALAKDWKDDLPVALITGGVHGYEAGGVRAALGFLENDSRSYLSAFNIVVVPCVSPWGFETNNRWNPYAVDPNRSFFGEGQSDESRNLIRFAKSLEGEVVVHIDLHETTDSDKTTFRPALAARDGVVLRDSEIPQGFYLVADEARDDLAFQKAIIDAVKEVTRIAPDDENGLVLDKPTRSAGIIEYPMTELGLCGSLTNAPFHTTTEVYPDGAWMSEAERVQGQVVTITSGLDFVQAKME